VAENLNFNLTVDSSSATQSINNFFNAFGQGSAKAKSELNKAFGQDLKTSVKVEFKNGKLVAKEIQNIRQDSNKLGEVWKAVNGKVGQTPNELKKQQSIIKALLGDTKKYETGTNKVTQEWKTLSARLDVVNASMKSIGGSKPLGGFMGQLTASISAANLFSTAVESAGKAIVDLVQGAMEMEVLQLQLEGLMGSSQAAQAAFSQFAQIAADSPFDLKQVADASRIMLAFGMETDQATKSTKQLSIVAGATGGDLQNMARNLGQIAAQGQAYTRDLTQFAIQGVPIWNQLSEVTGNSVTQLKKMASEGKISFELVESALSNLTKEGSKFREIAERMQETFQGRLARIAASFQELQLAAVQAFNKMDKAMGNIVSNSMKLFADGIKFIAANVTTLAKAFSAAAAAAVVYFTVQNWGAIVQAIRAVITIQNALTLAQKASAVAAAVLQGLMGNFGAVAAGLAAGVAVFAGLSIAIDSTNKEMEDLQGEAKSAGDAVGDLTEEELKLVEASDKDLAKNFTKLREEANAAAQELEKQVAILNEMKEQVKERYDNEIKQAKEARDITRQKISEEREENRALVQEIKSSYDERISKAREERDTVIEGINAQIDALRERTPEEQALYDFEKKKLQDKIKSGDLDEEELLRAQARLARMEKQEQISELLVQKKEKEKQFDSEIKDLQDQKQQQLDNQKKTYEETNKQLKEELKQQEDGIKNLKAARDSELETIESTIQATKSYTDEVEYGQGEIQKQVQLVDNLTQKWRDTEQAAKDAAAAAREATSSGGGSGSSSSGGPTTSNFAGGPIAAGTKSWVNELGKEAFLSASGRLSMINDRNGQWTAPSDGTIIPAHLTKQLDIPTGGINLNGAAASNASRAGSKDMNAMVKAIRSSMSGGDNISNNVTIQAINPTQAASDMMVNMNRVRRRRYT